MIAFNIMSATYRLGWPSHSSLCQRSSHVGPRPQLYSWHFTPWYIGLSKSICKSSKTGYPKIFCHCLCIVLVLYCKICNYWIVLSKYGWFLQLQMHTAICNNPIMFSLISFTFLCYYNIITGSWLWDVNALFFLLIFTITTVYLLIKYIYVINGWLLI